MSSSMYCCSRDRCSSKRSSQPSSIERGNCSYRSCSLCKNWHCSCTPCGSRERAKPRRRNSNHEAVFCRCRCIPRCLWWCEREDWWPQYPEFSFRDVIHEVKEKDIKVSWGDISKNSCYRGSVFNVCRAYIGDDEEKVAVKWVRPRHACGKDHGEKLIKESKESAKLVLDFMNHIGTKGWKVKVLIPKKGRGYFFHDVRSRSVIVEPYLKSFEPFYESSDDLKHLRGTTYGTVLQALIHFSIRHSKRESMISNLQGSVDYKKKTIYLSAPVIKKDFNSFSGKGSISAFLRNHDCSRMCRKH